MPNTGLATCVTHARPLMPDAQGAMLSTPRVNRPTVASDHENGFRPEEGGARWVGWKRRRPQGEGGGIPEPPVCVPTASGSMPAATAAAEPADEPPGVRPGALGLSVAVGFRKANSVVVV